MTNSETFSRYEIELLIQAFDWKINYLKSRNKTDESKLFSQLKERLISYLERC
jgi:hypothetical protein